MWASRCVAVGAHGFWLVLSTMAGERLRHVERLLSESLAELERLRVDDPEYANVGDVVEIVGGRDYKGRKAIVTGFRGANAVYLAVRKRRCDKESPMVWRKRTNVRVVSKANETRATGTTSS